jgi:hypothetical protein
MFQVLLFIQLAVMKLDLPSNAVYILLTALICQITYLLMSDKFQFQHHFVSIQKEFILFSVYKFASIWLQNRFEQQY